MIELIPEAQNKREKIIKKCAPMSCNHFHGESMAWPKQSLCLLLLIVQISACATMKPQSDVEREKAARDALEWLYEHTPATRALADQAAGVLVFPQMAKAGFLFGAQYGNGVLFKRGKAAGYYNSSAISYGLQAGVQRFGYALFFMTKKDLDYLSKSGGFELGVGPSVTVVDEGFAKSISTTTAREGIFAFFFEQKGLMAGLGIQGTKITKTD